MSDQVCIDSNALTYLVEAMTQSGKPTGSVADEKIALLRIYLYRNDVLYISPTVEAEYREIKDETRRRSHQGVIDVLMEEIPAVSNIETQARMFEYLGLHVKGENDCRILAESELGGGDILLTYDQGFLKQLRGRTKRIKLMTPSAFWQAIAIPKGARPVRGPYPSNPLSSETWWVW